MWRKLYFQIYLSIVGGIALLLLAIALLFAWEKFDQDDQALHLVTTIHELLSLVLEDADFDIGENSKLTQDTLNRLSRIHPEHQFRLALYSGDGKLLSFSGSSKPLDQDDYDEILDPLTDKNTITNWHQFLNLQKPLRIELKDDRYLLAQHLDNDDHLAFPFLGILLLFSLCIAVASYPVTRRLTRKLEHLKQGVEHWGRGDIDYRVPIEGCDEVSSLATSFNKAANQIENLLQAHKQLLANASHELRSPLARIRLAIELYEQNPTQEIAKEIRQNINELDQQIEEILLASRLDARLDESQELPTTLIDFTKLVTQLASQYDIKLDMPDQQPLLIQGHSRLLSIMVRNLLENAKRHGKYPIVIKVWQENKPGENTNNQKSLLVMHVLDHGPGILNEEREKIFTPFYRTKGSKEKDGSWGLGLSLVRQIVDRHQGQINCFNPNQGSWTNGFEVRLPLIN